MTDRKTADDVGADMPAIRIAPGRAVTAAILSVGSELLLGDLTDTNATWLSQRLRELGVDVVHHVAVRDQLDEFVDAVAWLAARVEVVVVGGGLGPTADDLTREAVAAAAGVPLERRHDLEAWLVDRFASMGRPMAPENLRQARIPAGGKALEPVGTAPGFVLTLPSPTPTRVFALPGVPWELRELFDRHVAPEIRAIAGPRTTLTRVVRVVGRGESDIAGVIEPLLDHRSGVTLSFLARQQEVHVRLTVTAEDMTAARVRSQPLVDEVLAALGASVVGVDEQTLEAHVVDLLTASGTTLATAESATAGDIAARLGRIPGASHGLLGAVVVYATALKRDLLGVAASLLDDHGSVSAEVTAGLATAVRDRVGADWGVAVTGVAGPAAADDLPDLPVGTSFWALANPEGEVEVHGRIIPGDRSEVIGRLGSTALDLLRRRLLER